MEGSKPSDKLITLSQLIEEREADAQVRVLKPLRDIVRKNIPASNHSPLTKKLLSVIANELDKKISNIEKNGPE